MELYGSQSFSLQDSEFTRYGQDWGLPQGLSKSDPWKIRLKKNSILAPVQIVAGDMERVEIFPLNVVFYLKSSKRILLRFGTTYHEVNEKILDEIIGFAEGNKIPMEVIEEKI